MPTVTLGINPLTWTNDDLPSLGRETPLETCLQEGREAGFSGFELGNKFPRTPDALNQVLSAHDLTLVSGWYSARLLERAPEEEIDAIQDHMNLLKECGAKVVVLCEVTHCVHGDQERPLSQRPHLRGRVAAPAEWPGGSGRLPEIPGHSVGISPPPGHCDRKPSRR
ncbi:hypothetical protein HSBAA_60540 [Vreelandella sulfidaeris]|uniref:Xylose isomerase-like TIM barrel domain-containing protein n=1 Tax=Vreelandella sulfidaeris TaxID=115553 RepID=A0A455UK64_9GAMM|nr:hypothetical protein HSBAA_60540 [Halomonas sulfidaeris]